MDNKTINEIAAQIAQNYERAEVPMYGQRLCLPDRASVIAILELLQKLLFPAYFGDTQLLRLPPAQYSALLLQELAEKLTEQIARATGACTDDSAADAANQLLQQLPQEDGQGKAENAGDDGPVDQVHRPGCMSFHDTPIPEMTKDDKGLPPGKRRADGGCSIKNRP